MAATLGATLYLPGTREDLIRIAFGGRLPDLRSAVVCLEDSVAARDLPVAVERVRRLLEGLAAAGPSRPGPALFLRAPDPALLADLVRVPGAERLAGFVLPKATASSVPHWLAALSDLPPAWILPTIETPEAFDPGAMAALRRALEAEAARVLCVRIGGNDLLQLLGARRSRTRTAYEGPLGPVIASLVGTFAPAGFALSAPVLEWFDEDELLRQEVIRDLEHGLATKTCIHPRQVEVVHDVYRVCPREHGAAQAILDTAAPAVFGHDGGMLEPATHRRWAEGVTARAAAFGLAGAGAVTLTGVVAGLA